MERISGTGIYGGIAIGNLYFVKRNRPHVKRIDVQDTATEHARFESAKQAAIAQLGELYQKALPEVGESGAALFEIHQMMIEDEDFCESVNNIIEIQKANAEYAVARSGDNFSRMFSEMEDPYIRERAADVRDISARLIRCLTGSSSAGIVSDEPVIVAADDLSPSETIQLDKSKILAFVTEEGNVNSHTAILARTMGIPAIVRIGTLSEEFNGAFSAVDGFTGELIINPDEETLKNLLRKKQEEEHRKDLLKQFKGKPNKTIDGKEILVYANIGGISDLGLVQGNDAGGIGLFRSEFSYLNSEDYPDEESLFYAYKIVAQTMAGKRVVIRTMDIGADKRIGYFNLPQEENPALGLRGIRLCLDRTELFKTQLRAIYRASAYGHVAVMFPMIASVWELQAGKAMVEKVKAELENENIAFSPDVEIGVMIETPAAAITSDLLAPECDFFSIGTNDLTQYTLAADRQNHTLKQYCDTHHEAILRLIQTSVDNAHKHGIWIGICGELASDLSLTERFLRMGIDELSVSPASVLELRKKISEIDLTK
jgi:phosphotransferase system enzyme I (PtsI)